MKLIYNKVTALIILAGILGISTGYIMGSQKSATAKTAPVNKCPSEDSVLVKLEDGTLTPLWAIDDGRRWSNIEETYCVVKVN